MKTAVLLTGQIRDAKNCCASIKEKIIDAYNADVFVETWLPENKPLDHRDKFIPNDMSADELLSIYRPKLAIFEDFENSPLMNEIKGIDIQNKIAYDGSWAHETKVANIFYMHYKIWRCFRLMKSYEITNQIKYDCIIKLRFDLEFEDFKLAGLEEGSIYIPEGFGHRGGINDLMSYGPPSTMEVYCNLFQHLMSYSDAGLGFHPESLLRFHLEHNKLDIKRFPIKYKLRGDYV